MKALIIGSKQLSVDILRILLRNNVEVLAAITRDDEPGMRTWHEALGHENLNATSSQLGIPVYEGLKINSDEAKRLIEELAPDVIFSCFWGEIIRKSILEIPPMGIFNFHTALLPKNRGSRAIPWAIIRGESEAGITLHQMAPGVDDGPMVAQAAVAITKLDTAKSLYDKVTMAGARMFEKEVKNFIDGSLTLTEQPFEQSTYQPRGEPFGGQINAYWSDEQKSRFKRAFTFPPFRGWRPPPKPSMHSKPSVFFVPTDETDALNLPRHPSQWKTQSIGTASERKELKANLSIVSDHIGIIGDLDTAFSVHDVLQMKGVKAVTSREIEALEWKESYQKAQPFRYENGLLEIPATRIKQVSDIDQLAASARDLMAVHHRDLFIGISINPSVKRSECFATIKKLNCDLLTPQQVIEHYDTDYETISA